MIYLFVVVIFILDGFAVFVFYVIVLCYVIDLGKVNLVLLMIGEVV